MSQNEIKEPGAEFDPWMDMWIAFGEDNRCEFTPRAQRLLWHFYDKDRTAIDNFLLRYVLGWKEEKGKPDSGFSYDGFTGFKFACPTFGEDWVLTLITPEKKDGRVSLIASRSMGEFRAMPSKGDLAAWLEARH